jgi:hypothetical protein
MAIDRALLKASWESWLSNDNRERAGPPWLQWLWTLLLAAAMAVPFTVVTFFSFGVRAGAWHDLPRWLGWYGKNLIVCTTICVLIHLLFDISRALWAPPQRVALWRPWQRTLFFGGVPMLGVLLGWPLGLQFAGADLARWFASERGINALVGTVIISLIVTAVLHTWFSAKTRQLDAERRATEAQLRLLQGQIEPHFLFNTLANVQSLMDHDLPKARQMLASFTDYLRASLGTLRGEDSRVAHELELAQSYLQLLQRRMEDRLRFTIEADEAARSLPLPPLLLQPLVENAVVHGLEPSIEGGHVRVSARLAGRQLLLEVQDDGRGPGAAPRPGRPGAGLALANIRQRLAARYGSAATLQVLAAEPGTLARITLPLDTA